MALNTVVRSLLNDKKKAIWFWQINTNSSDVNCQEQQWQCYSDFENEYIEECYSKRKKEVKLNDIVINFKTNMQFNINDNTKQNSIKREEINISQYVREERFSNSEKRIKSFIDQNEYDLSTSIFLTWWTENYEISKNYSTVAELAAQGILQEGKLINKQFDAQYIAFKLRSCDSDTEILESVARIYSSGSFLYKLLNETLREVNMNKLNTLGPFSYLLWLCINNNNDIGEHLLYRGTTLTNDMIEDYKKSVGTYVHWSAFTSTTKDRAVAEMFSTNVLFIIQIGDDTRYHYQRYIAPFSHYPAEQEVLLTTAYPFMIDKVEYDTTSEKHLIWVKECFHLNPSSINIGDMLENDYDYILDETEFLY